MKNLYVILTVIIGAVLMTACDMNHDNGDTCPAKPGTHASASGLPAGMSGEKFTYDGHSYIRFTQSRGTTVIHDPGCSCMLRYMH